MRAQAGEEVDAGDGGGDDVFGEPGVLESLGSGEAGVGVDGEAALDEVAGCGRGLGRVEERRREGEPESETPCQYSAGSKA